MTNHNTLYHYYRVDEFVTTFGQDPGCNDPYHHTQDFKDDDLLTARKETIRYFNQRLTGFKNGKYFLPFAAPQDFKLGENSAFSINLLFVQVFENGEEYEWVILGEPEEEEDAATYEKQILNK